MAHPRGSGWLPHSQTVRGVWLDDSRLLRARNVTSTAWPFHPVILELKTLIEETPELYDGFQEMFSQVPRVYDEDPTGEPQVRDYITMLARLDDILTSSPCFQTNDLVGFPVNAMLNWPMNTPAGAQTFQNPALNAQLLAIFKVWASFLISPESCYVLDDAEDGWFGPAARRAMPDFEDTFICDPHAPYHGFTSWDNFFTRQLRPGVRPIEYASNDLIINSPCESRVYRMATRVQAVEEFWLKGQPYSLMNILNDDPLSSQFVNGSIYQAFLSATNYHRWHAPVNGTVEKLVHIPGTYYATSPAQGFSHNPLGPDPAAPTRSQAYLTAVATRALIFIRADSSSIGLMCFVAVGMAEVSTCEITVQKGDRVKKGDQLGLFHFGGSTSCLIFRPQTKIQWNPSLKTDMSVRINSAIAAAAE